MSTRFAHQLAALSAARAVWDHYEPDAAGPSPALTNEVALSELLSDAIFRTNTLRSRSTVFEVTTTTPRRRAGASQASSPQLNSADEAFVATCAKKLTHLREQTTKTTTATRALDAETRPVAAESLNYVRARDVQKRQRRRTAGEEATSAQPRLHEPLPVPLGDGQTASLEVHETKKSTVTQTRLRGLLLRFLRHALRTDPKLAPLVGQPFNASTLAVCTPARLRALLQEFKTWATPHVERLQVPSERLAFSVSSKDA